MTTINEGKYKLIKREGAKLISINKDYIFAKAGRHEWNVAKTLIATIIMDELSTSIKDALIQASKMRQEYEIFYLD